MSRSKSSASGTSQTDYSSVRTETMGPYVVIEGTSHKVVRYSVLHENEQVFASRYKLVLPSEEELREELERERNQLATLTDQS
jgi:hypothetical protein